jgi:hypothetical protein
MEISRYLQKILDLWWRKKDWLLDFQTLNFYANTFVVVVGTDWYFVKQFSTCCLRGMIPQAVVPANVDRAQQDSISQKDGRC